MVEGRRVGEWEIEDRTQYREFVTLRTWYGQQLILGSCRLNVGVSARVGPAEPVQVGKMDACNTQVGTHSLDSILPRVASSAPQWPCSGSAG